MTPAAGSVALMMLPPMMAPATAANPDTADRQDIDAAIEVLSK